MRIQTVNIIKNIVASMSVTFFIDNIIDNGDGTFTLETSFTWWLSVKSTVTIAGTDYIIDSFIINQSITITASVQPIATFFVIPAPTFLYGTLKMANSEVKEQTDKTLIFPMCYFLEPSSDRFSNDDESMIDRESDIRLFWLESANTGDWLTEDHYLNVIEPMQSMVDFFNSKIKVSALFTDDTRTEDTNLPNISTDREQLEALFDCDLSGIEEKVFAEIRKSSSCSDIPTETCSPATVTDSDGITVYEVASGGVFACTPAVSPSGIAYKKPILTGQLTSYATGDDAWNLANGVYDYTPPSYPVSYADLDTTDVAPFLTLKDNNAFGNTDRFTDDAGGQTYANDYVIDHLTGLGWYRVYYGNNNINWADSIAAATALTLLTFSDWRVPNYIEMMSLANHEGVAGFTLNYAPFNTNDPGDGKYLWTSTSASINPSLVASVFESRLNAANGMVLTIAAKSLLRNYYVCRKHY